MHAFGSLPHDVSQHYYKATFDQFDDFLLGLTCSSTGSSKSSFRSSSACNFSRILFADIFNVSVCKLASPLEAPFNITVEAVDPGVVVRCNSKSLKEKSHENI
jgi:hypothetical protein